MSSMSYICDANIDRADDVATDPEAADLNVIVTVRTFATEIQSIET